jgi:hypothetical protein
MGGERSTYGRRETNGIFRSEELKGRRHFEYIGVRRKIILK